MVLDLLVRLKKEGRTNIPVLMLTTEGQATLITQAKESGAKDGWSSPSNPKLLLAAVQKLTRAESSTTRAGRCVARSPRCSCGKAEWTIGEQIVNRIGEERNGVVAQMRLVRVDPAFVPDVSSRIQNDA